GSNRGILQPFGRLWEQNVGYPQGFFTINRNQPEATRISVARALHPGYDPHAIAGSAGALAARSRTNLATPTMSILPVPSTGSFSSTTPPAGPIRSGAPFCLAKAWNSARVAPFFCVPSPSRSPLRASGAVATADSTSGQSCAASISTAASEIISPPILA